MPVLVQTMRVHEVGVGHAQLLGLLVHELDKGFLRACDVNCNVLRCVVCRVDEHHAEKLAQRWGVTLHKARGLGIGAQVRCMNLAGSVKVNA